jgi:hypothetical protein
MTELAARAAVSNIPASIVVVEREAGSGTGPRRGIVRARSAQPIHLITVFSLLFVEFSADG